MQKSQWVFRVVAATVVGGVGAAAFGDCTPVWLPGTTGTDGLIHALAPVPGGMLAGGEFTSIEGVTANQVTLWSNGAWSSLGGGLFVPGNLPEGAVPVVSAVMRMPNGDVVVGGSGLAAVAGGDDLPIARWDGIAWSPFSPGLTLVDFGFGGFGFVGALAIRNGHLVAGGLFAIEGDPLTPYALAEWDGTSWKPLMTAQLFAIVYSISVTSDDGLIVGGSFSEGDTGVTGADNIAQWDGVSTYEDDGTAVWTTLGYGADAAVFATAIMPNGDVIVGGPFEHVGNTTSSDTSAPNIARWDGDTWTTLGQSILDNDCVDRQVESLLVLPNGDLIVGGDFAYVGNTTPGDLRVNYLARWNEAASMWSPLGMGIDDADDPCTFTVEGLNHHVSALALDDDGVLWIGGQIHTAGGETSVNIARWGCPVAACAADFNGVNGVTVQDIFDFLTAWLGGSPSADFNHVNGVTVQDIFDFLTAWLAGC